MLMNQYASSRKRKRAFTDLSLGCSGRYKVTSKVRDEAVGKMAVFVDP